MKAELISVHRFLSMPDGVFIIPIYQRHYSWTDIQCKQLWNDVVAVAVGDHPSHFIGSVVCQDDPKLRRGTVIIDGQQRVTTLMLLFRALMDSSDDELFKRRVSQNYLINTNAIDDQTRLRLKPVAKDAKAFVKLMNITEDVKPDAFTADEQDGNAYKNYFLFRSLIKQTLRSKSLTIDDLERVVEDLEVIEIRLQGENAQVVFESLNSRGLTLAPVDLIRNFILMAMPYGEQERLYKTYWRPIEEAVGSERLQDFMLQWLIIRKRSDNLHQNGRSAKLSKRTIYDGYKTFFGDLCAELGGVDKCLGDMLAYAKVYGHIYDVIGKGESSMPKTDRLCVGILDGIKASKSTALIMYLIRRRNDGAYNDKVLEDMLTALASYCTRQLVCGSRGAIGLQTVARIIKQMSLWDDASDQSALATFWNAITSFVGKDAFPGTTMFATNLRRFDMYQVRGGLAKYILYSIEEQGPNAKEIPANDKSITIEHVMPQTLSESWVQYLEEREDDDNYVDHVHMLGNLCLTGYNSEMGNKDFSDKKGYYTTSSFYYTKDIAKSDEWTSAEIEARTTMLANLACKVWPLPRAYDTGNRVIPDKWYPLDTDPVAFRGMKPGRMSFMSRERTVATWVDFLVRCISMCYLLDEQVLASFAKKQATDGAPWLSTNEKDLRSAKRVSGTPYYASFGVSSEQILLRAQELADEYKQDIGVDLLQEIQVTVKNPLITRR